MLIAETFALLEATMIANYHTHTPRCMHATGAEEEYVRCAIEAGYQILGFADHTPYPFTNGYVSHFRMSVAALSEYAEICSKISAASSYSGPDCAFS